ncbi:tRNA 2-thiouridine(34) synthase MnmA [Candidatus Pacearchaeota archaeon ex4484_71]|nr:MAG: tRNA 2-thiouridine(34) synthase MnmA [Candidatus Pacearchaeota archaeon ex4484_71]
MMKRILTKKKQKVLLAMSGGVDSSVAALLLKKKGYDVYGAFMKNWSDTKNKITGRCAWRDERDHAIKIASKLGIPLTTLDFEKEYKKLVVDEMFKKYKKGITPNPDVDCNEKIKFPLLIKAAKKMGVDYIATGHYARIKKRKEKYELHRAKDESKDQSYFLYRQTQEDLKYTLFPIGNFTKKKIRKIAKKNNFQNYNKKGTVGICFIGKINLKEFLSKKIKPKRGNILDPDGNKIGTHDGIYYYTIGQRLGPRYGFEIKRQDPKTKRMVRWYVAKKDKKKNMIIAAPEDHPLLFRKKIILKEFHLIDLDKNKFLKEISSKPKSVLTRIRQVGELLDSKISKEKGKIILTLKEGIKGISEGQAAVIYAKTKCLGGGVISE